MHALRAAHLEVEELETLAPDLEDVFLKLTGADRDAAGVPAAPAMPAP